MKHLQFSPQFSSSPSLNASHIQFLPLLLSHLIAFIFLAVCFLTCLFLVSHSGLIAEFRMSAIHDIYLLHLLHVGYCLRHRLFKNVFDSLSSSFYSEETEAQNEEQICSYHLVVFYLSWVLSKCRLMEQGVCDASEREQACVRRARG